MNCKISHSFTLNRFLDWLECIWIAFSHFLRGTAFVIGCQNHISREINTIILINNITLFVRICVRSWKAISGWIKPVSVTITSLVCKPPLRATRTLSFWPSVFHCSVGLNLFKGFADSALQCLMLCTKWISM